MEISRPNQELSAAEQQELERLKTIIERATADGVITRAERDQISAAMRADGKVTVAELELVRTLLRAKVEQGGLTLDYT
ncbi:hypothetical protein [Leptolyngbya sp. 7M]|uniref:hypothetical protein n=1 Tax=Leptolyngbya sp. 7M TaxID=2812896 RepID=UPI001B8CA679|nr:hypothetical protein [Leptolyngbya sp. 7M]QYO68379.1 hypothetical protein JVX88_17375 [Leptolyngbya sp. 7M]